MSDLRDHAVLWACIKKLRKEALRTNDAPLQFIATTLEYTGETPEDLYEVFTAAILELAQRNRILSEQYIKALRVSPLPPVIIPPKEKE